MMQLNAEYLSVKKCSQTINYNGLHVFFLIEMAEHKKYCPAIIERGCPFAYKLLLDTGISD